VLQKQNTRSALQGEHNNTFSASDQNHTLASAHLSLAQWTRSNDSGHKLLCYRPLPRRCPQRRLYGLLRLQHNASRRPGAVACLDSVKTSAKRDRSRQVSFPRGGTGAKLCLNCGDKYTPAPSSRSAPIADLFLAIWPLRSHVVLSLRSSARGRSDQTIVGWRQPANRLKALVTLVAVCEVVASNVGRTQI
jgi:hypothetical protein